jgi:hypothetical protein
LYGKTPAGHAEIPGSWVAKLLGHQCRDVWFALNLRDRDHLPILSSLENAALEGQLRHVLNTYRTNRALMANRAQNFALVARSVRIGDALLLLDGGTANVSSLSVRQDHLLVYNLHVTDNHTYAVAPKGPGRREERQFTETDLHQLSQFMCSFKDSGRIHTSGGTLTQF